MLFVATNILSVHHQI